MIIQFCKGFPFYYHVSGIQKCVAAFSQPVCNVAQSILQFHEVPALWCWEIGNSHIHSCRGHL